MVGGPARDWTGGVPGTEPERRGRGAQQRGCGPQGAGGWGDPRAKGQEEGECGFQQIGRRGQRNKEGLGLEPEVGARTARDAGLEPPEQPCASPAAEGASVGPHLSSPSSLGESSSGT